MDWKLYMNDMVYGIRGIGFIVNKDLNPPRVNIFVGFGNDSEGISFIDKMGYWYSHHRPPDRCSFSSSVNVYTFDKSGELINRYINTCEVLELISAAKDLGTVHEALAKPLEKIICSLEKATKK